MISTILVSKKVFSKTLLSLLILFSIYNTYSSAKLTLFSYIDVFLEKPVLWNTQSEEYYQDAAFHIDQLQIIDGKLLIRGWLYNQKNGKTFDNVHLVLKNNKEFYKIKLKNITRPDVASAFKNTDLRSSGFSAKMVDLTKLKKGTYQYLFSVVVDNKIMFIDIGSSLKI